MQRGSRSKRFRTVRGSSGNWSESPLAPRALSIQRIPASKTMVARRDRWKTRCINNTVDKAATTAGELLRRSSAIYLSIPMSDPFVASLRGGHLTCIDNNEPIFHCSDLCSLPLPLTSYAPSFYVNPWQPCRPNLPAPPGQTAREN